MKFRFNGEIIECTKETAIIGFIAWECCKIPRFNAFAHSLFDAINDGLREE